MAATADTQDVDMTSWREEHFEEKCTYIVKDQPLEEESENKLRTRAERSLPRNLSLKRSHDSAEVCCKDHFSDLLVYLFLRRKMMQENTSRVD